jgi:hypothetical protein
METEKNEELEIELDAVTDVNAEGDDLEVDNQVEEESAGNEGDENSENNDDEETAVIVDGYDNDGDDGKASAPAWVKDLRKAHREMKRENRELRRQIEMKSGGQGKIPELGKKPTLEDFDYDTDAFSDALESWHDRKREIDSAVAAKQAAEEKERSAWKNKIDGYIEKKNALKIKNFDDLEETVTSELDVVQQGIIVDSANNPAAIIAAIGGNQRILSELKSITNPVQFAYAIGKLEGGVKIGKGKKSAPAPERRVSGSGSASGSVDSHLERLRADAERTGDYTKVIAYKRKSAK